MARCWWKAYSTRILNTLYPFLCSLLAVVVVVFRAELDASAGRGNHRI